MLIYCSQSVFGAAHKLDRFAVIDIIHKDILGLL
jgi:hypothetical protein